MAGGFLAGGFLAGGFLAGRLGKLGGPRGLLLCGLQTLCFGQGPLLRLLGAQGLGRPLGLLGQRSRQALGFAGLLGGALGGFGSSGLRCLLLLQTQFSQTFVLALFGFELFACALLRLALTGLALQEGSLFRRALGFGSGQCGLAQRGHRWLGGGRYGLRRRHRLEFGRGLRRRDGPGLRGVWPKGQERIGIGLRWGGGRRCQPPSAQTRGRCSGGFGHRRWRRRRGGRWQRSVRLHRPGGHSGALRWRGCGCGHQKDTEAGRLGAALLPGQGQPGHTSPFAAQGQAQQQGVQRQREGHRQRHALARCGGRRAVRPGQRGGVPGAGRPAGRARRGQIGGAQWLHGAALHSAVAPHPYKPLRPCMACIVQSKPGVGLCVRSAADAATLAPTAPGCTGLQRPGAEMVNRPNP